MAERSEVAVHIHLQQQKPIPLSVELECKAGELLALVGPSGSGKTTILFSIAGLHKSEQGFVRCQDEIWQDSSDKLFWPVHQRHVGIVFQHYALFPHMTVLDNIQQSLSELPKLEQKKEALKLLKKVHLEGLESRYPKALSGGQQQRVAVARALARNPKVLLLDEPFSAVDQVTRRKLYRELLELRHLLNIPMILVTHDLDEATLLADRIALLHKGKILQTGSPDFVSSHPETATVARLIDQQNLFTAKVVDHDERSQTTQLRWRNRPMEAAYQPNFPAGQRVCWMIQPSSIMLHRRDKPTKGDQENPFLGPIVEQFESRGLSNLLVEIDPELKINIAVTVPFHVARRNALAVGERIGISLLKEEIHLMPYQALKRDIL
jgi:molybdate transport system ATP-binding protein